MNGTDFKRVILYMANRWDRDEAHAIFGKVMGDHFFSKWVGAGGGDHGTMRLFYDMSEDYLDKIVNRALEYYQSRKKV